MGPETLFSMANLMAISGWLLLILAGRVRSVGTLITGAIIPLLFALAYTALVVTNWGNSQGGFGSISQVRELFSNDWLLLAGWVHYLAFDLFVGSWQVQDARKYRIPHLALIPSLILTFLFGPAGFLIYMLIRLPRSRTLSLNA
jgi:hypothetical protein